MLETFRKYTGLMFVVLILLFIGLVFFGSTGSNPLSGKPVLVAYGKGYTDKEVKQFAEKPAQMLKDLSGEIYSPRYQAVEPFLSRMGVITYNRFRLTEDQVTSFLINRVALQRAMKEFGVAASTAEVEQFLKETVFSEEGKFNEKAYDEFQEAIKGKLGMRVKQMNEIVGEMIALKKLEDIVGAGVTASREAVLAKYLHNTQRITYQLVALSLKEFEDKQMPTEEELRAHWEPKKESYLSKPKRRITYILAQPDYAALEKAKAENDAAPEAEDENADAPEDAPAEKPATDSKLTPEERKEAVNDLARKLDDLHDDLYDAKGEGFEELAKNYGFEVKTTELLAKDEFPSELTSPKVANVPNKTGADVVFDHLKGDELVQAYGDIKKLGSDQWFLFRVDEVAEPTELSFEEAKDRVRSDVVRDAALEAMEEAAKAKRDALVEALKGGQSFAEAAKELELNVTPNVDATRPPDTGSPEQTAFNLAARTNPGEVSEVKVDTSEDPEGVNRAIFAYVEKREVYENENLDTLIDRQVEDALRRNRTLALANWFAQQTANADLKIPSRD